MAKFRVLDTAPAQFTIAYDGANSAPFTCSSTGDLTIAPTGGDIAVTGNLVATGRLGAGSRTFLTDKVREWAVSTSGTGTKTLATFVIPASSQFVKVEVDAVASRAGAASDRNGTSNTEVAVFYIMRADGSTNVVVEKVVPGTIVGSGYVDTTNTAGGDISALACALTIAVDTSAGATASQTVTITGMTGNGSGGNTSILAFFRCLGFPAIAPS